MGRPQQPHDRTAHRLRQVDRPAMQTDVLDEDGNLRAADIGITWADNETFLHGVRVVGTKFSRPTGQETTIGSTTNRLTGRRGSVTSAPSLMSTVGQKNREHCNWCPTSTRPP